MINVDSKIRISPDRKKMRVVNSLSKRIFLALLMLSSSMAIAFLQR